MKVHMNQERSKEKKSGWGSKESRLAYLFMAPLLLCLVAFMVVPMITGIQISFQNAKGEFTGLKNYQIVLGEPRFWNNVRLSLSYVICNVLLSIVLGFLAANLITQKSKMVSILRPLYLIPWIIPPVSSSILFRTLLDANTGPVTHLIKVITGKNVMILDQAKTALLAVIFHNFWRSFPFAMLFLAAGLTMISKDVYEAAIVDGASKVKQFFYITLPLVKNHLFIVILMITNWTLQDSESCYSLTKGGPGTATEMVAVRLFKDSFVYFEVHTGVVIGIVMMCISIIFATIYYWVTKAKEMESYE